MTPTGLYVHVPFCLSRCGYCAFASGVYHAGRADAYLEALGMEFAERVEGFAPETVYVGGGTPTALGRERLENLLDLMTSFLETDRLREFTVEANPGTLSMEKLFLLREAGVTRVSLGVQTFHPEGLRVLGRAHDARQARTAVAMIREVGFDNLALDFICDWPGQTVDGWYRDLHRAVELGAEHLSCYGLTYEPGTRLDESRRAGRIRPLSESASRELFDFTGAFLRDRDRPRYEISNFCRPGHACLHNVNYWTGGEFLGLGAAAHSHEDGVRYANCADADSYISMTLNGVPARTFEERLEPERLARECAVIWLRLSEGIDVGAFAERTGFGLEALFGDAIGRLVEGGWLVWSADAARIRLTDRALPVADSILAELV